MVSINFEDALKAKKLRAYFNEHGRIYILVDATSDDVMVPDFLKGDPALPLVLNARMPQPIHIRDSFLESNFSFSGVSHHCVIPMNRIWASYLPESDMSSGLVWDAAMPEMVKLMMGEADLSEPDLSDSSLPEQNNENKERKGDEASEQPEPLKLADQPGKRVGHLRVIK